MDKWAGQNRVGRNVHVHMDKWAGQNRVGRNVHVHTHTHTHTLGYSKLNGSINKTSMQSDIILPMTKTH